MSSFLKARQTSLGAARLWRIEWLKISRLRSFWIVSGLYVLLIPLLYQFFMNSVVQVGGQEIQASTFFGLSGRQLWDFMLFTGSYGVYLFILLVLSYTNQERGCGLWRQYVSDGMPAADLVSGKYLLLLGLAGFSAALLFLGWAAIMLLTDAGSPPPLSVLAGDLFAYGLYFAAFLSLAFALNLIIGRTALSFILVLLWGLILESMLRWLLPELLALLLPVHQLNALIPNPLTALLDGGINPGTEVAAYSGNMLRGVMWGGAGLIASYIILQRRDIS